MKNKICKGIVWALPIICLAIFSACKDPMKDYYDNGKYTGVGTETLLDVIKSNPEYSTFALLLEETGMDQLLAGNDMLTVWVPRNVDMPSEMAHLDDEQKAVFINNHLSLGAITFSDLSLYTQVATLSGRIVPVSVRNGVAYVNEAALVKTDMMCKNGVVQEISEWFLPRETLYEMLESLPSEYSIFRDSLLGRTFKVFDKENSIPIATAEDGSPIYDTVWILENEILEMTDISEIAETFTFFVPTNDAMLNMYSEMTNYLNAAQYPISEEDTSKWVDWVLKASISKGQQIYEPNKWIFSSWSPQSYQEEVAPGEWNTYGTVYDYDIHTGYQIVYNDTPTQYANGWSYDWNEVRVPKSMYMPYIQIYPWWIRKWMVIESGSNPWAASIGNLDSWTEPVDYSLSQINDGAQTVRLQFGRPGRLDDGALKAEYSFFTVSPWMEEDPSNPENLVSSVKLKNFMPGNYYVAIQLRNSGVFPNLDTKLDELQLIINGESFDVKRISRGTYEGAAEISSIPLYVPGTYAPAEVTLSLPPFNIDELDPEDREMVESVPDRYRAWRRIEVGAFVLQPHPYENY